MKIVSAYPGARCGRCDRLASVHATDDSRLVDIVDDVPLCARCVEDKTLGRLRLQVVINEAEALWERRGPRTRGGQIKSEFRPQLVVGDERPVEVDEPPVAPPPQPVGGWPDRETPEVLAEAPVPDPAWKAEAVARRREIIEAQAKRTVPSFSWDQGPDPVEDQRSEDKWSARLREPHEEPKIAAQREALRKYLSSRPARRRTMSNA